MICIISLIMVIFICDLKICFSNASALELNSKRDPVKRKWLLSSPRSSLDATNETSSSKLETRTFLDVIHGRFLKPDNYMALCESNEDCNVGIRMICEKNRCSCRSEEILVEWPKYGCFVKARMFESCELSRQCMEMNPNTFCNSQNGRCTCAPNYFFNGHECSLRYDTSSLKAQEVYKAAVVAAACFIVAVVGIFVACIVRRSFCRRDHQLQQSDSNRNSDIFSISDEIAAMRAVDKPPSYEEVLQIERTFYGIPPPEYSGPRSEASSQASIPALPSDSRTLPSSSTLQSTSTILSDSNRNESLSSEAKGSPNCSGPVDRSIHCEPASLANSPSDLVVAADVLPVPSTSDKITYPLLHQASSHPAFTSPISLTPPPRLYRDRISFRQGSTSLPSSPNLSVISSRFLDSHKKSDLPGILPCGNSPLHSETSAPELQERRGNTTNISEHEHAITVIAYDNLGFESDLYL